MEAEILNEGYENDPRKNIHSIYVKEMIINPFAYVQPINYTMEAFVAPANFDPDAQELNIVKAFAAYPNANKKYIFSVGTSATTVLPAVYGRSYAYAENGGAYTTIESGTITWEAGSTKRNVIGISIYQTVLATAPIGAIWLFASANCNSIRSNHSNQTLKYLTAESLDSITSLPDASFYENSGLTGILTIPNSLVEFVNSDFTRCTNIYGNLHIPNSVTSIGNQVFRECLFTGNLIIPNSVTKIGSTAFSNMPGLNGVIQLSNSLNYIGAYAFTNSLFTGDLIIPNSVAVIKDYAFANCIGLNGIIQLSNSMTEISAAAFYYCKNITGNLIIPNSVVKIGDSAFGNCTSMNGYIDIPTSVSIIDGDAFLNMNNITHVNSRKSSPPSIKEKTFRGVNKNKTIHVPVGSLAAYQAAPYWNEFTNIIADL